MNVVETILYIAMICSMHTTVSTYVIRNKKLMIASFILLIIITFTWAILESFGGFTR